MIHPILAQVDQFCIWDNIFLQDSADPRIFVTKDDYKAQYLHSDGVFRNSTKYEGNFTGYYETVDEAKAAIDLYKSLNGLS